MRSNCQSLQNALAGYKVGKYAKDLYVFFWANKFSGNSGIPRKDSPGGIVGA